MATKANIGIDGIQRHIDRDVEISKNIAQIFNSPTGKAVLQVMGYPAADLADDGKSDNWYRTRAGMGMSGVNTATAWVAVALPLH